MSPPLREGWTAAALVAMGACTPAPPPGPSPPPGAAPAPAGIADAAGQSLRGTVIVGKDGYGFTACGAMHQQRVEFSAPAQAVVDEHLDRGGAMEFAIEGRGTTRDGRLVIAALSISPATGACEATPEADAPPA